VKAHAAVLREILEEQVSSSRMRCNPRGVKRKMSNWNVRDRSLICNARSKPIIHIKGLK
jgi:hypothetical protein